VEGKCQSHLYGGTEENHNEPQNFLCVFRDSNQVLYVPNGRQKRYCSADIIRGEAHIEFLFLWRFAPTRTMATSFSRFLDHAQRHTTVGRTPLDKRSAPLIDLNLTICNTHNRQTSMPPVGFEKQSQKASGRRHTL
jgi:hypothetical protein